MDKIEVILRKIREKYLFRIDARRNNRNHGQRVPEEDIDRWVTLSGAAVPIVDGELGGEVGERIAEQTEHYNNSEARSVTRGSGHNLSLFERQRAGSDAVKAEVEEKIRNGEIRTRIKRADQMKHVFGSSEYRRARASGKYPSVLSLRRNEWDALVQRALDDGVYFHTERNPEAIRIYYENDSYVGIKRSRNGRNRQRTKAVEIHLSRNGVHIVPVGERG